jgi:hypothetical protein
MNPDDIILAVSSGGLVLIVNELRRQVAKLVAQVETLTVQIATVQAVCKERHEHAHQDTEKKP